MRDTILRTSDSKFFLQFLVDCIRFSNRTQSSVNDNILCRHFSAARQSNNSPFSPTLRATSVSASGMACLNISFGAPIFSTLIPVGGNPELLAAGAGPRLFSGRMASCSTSVIRPSTIFRRMATATVSGSAGLGAGSGFGRRSTSFFYRSNKGNLLRFGIGNIKFIGSLP